MIDAMYAVRKTIHSLYIAHHAIVLNYHDDGVCHGVGLVERQAGSRRQRVPRHQCNGSRCEAREHCRAHRSSLCLVCFQFVLFFRFDLMLEPENGLAIFLMTFAQRTSHLGLLVLGEDASRSWQKRWLRARHIWPSSAR